jgi:hypothetical protein
MVQHLFDWSYDDMEREVRAKFGLSDVSAHRRWRRARREDESTSARAGMNRSWNAFARSTAKYQA